MLLPRGLSPRCVLVQEANVQLHEDRENWAVGASGPASVARAVGRSADLVGARHEVGVICARRVHGVRALLAEDSASEAPAAAAANGLFEGSGGRAVRRF